MNNDKNQKQLLHRLNRISGQIKGVTQMIKDDRDCSAIIIQVAAIRAAVSQLGLMIIESHMETCIDEAVKKGNSKKLIDGLNKVMKQMLK